MKNIKKLTLLKRMIVLSSLGIISVLLINSCQVKNETKPIQGTKNVQQELNEKAVSDMKNHFEQYKIGKIEDNTLVAKDVEFVFGKHSVKHVNRYDYYIKGGKNKTIIYDNVYNEHVWNVKKNLEKVTLTHTEKVDPNDKTKKILTITISSKDDKSITATITKTITGFKKKSK